MDQSYQHRTDQPGTPPQWAPYTPTEPSQHTKRMDLLEFLKSLLTAEVPDEENTTAISAECQPYKLLYPVGSARRKDIETALDKVIVEMLNELTAHA